MRRTLPNMESRERRLILFLYIGTVGLMLFLMYVTHRNVERYVTVSREVRYQNQLLLDLEGVMGLLQDQESGARGYLLSGDTAFLDYYTIALSQRPAREEHVRRAVEGSTWKADVDSLLRQTARASDMHRLLVLNGAKRVQRRADRERLMLGKGTMDDARDLHRELVARVRRETRRLLEQTDADGPNSPMLIGAYSVMAILASTLLFWRLSRALRMTAAVKDDLRMKVDALDEEVRARSAVQGLLQKVLDTSPVGIMTFLAVRGDDGTIVDFEWRSANRCATDLLAQPNLMGRRLLAEMPGRQGAGGFQDLAQVVETGHAAHGEHRVAVDGGERWFAEQYAKLDDGVLVVFADVSEQRRLRELAIEAERAELASQITRTFAHEVRNPLTNIQLALEQHQEELGEAVAGHQELLGVISRNLERIGTLVKDMLESTRKREVDLRPCDLADVMNQAMGKVADRLALLGMRGRVESDASPYAISGDPDLLVLALTNLLVNAVEAMEPDHGDLILRAARAHDCVVLEIIDNGKGMTEEVRERLFEPFFSARRGGLGLGLTTARTILNAHEVRMTVDSEEGRGTRFILEFPRA